MVAPIYSNRKGIYKDLYREIDADNKKKKPDIDSNIRRPKKGIYVELYRQIEFKNNDNNSRPNNLYTLALKQLIKDILSQSSRYFSKVTSEIKFLIAALMVAKKPINNYIESDINYSNLGCYNDR